MQSFSNFTAAGPSKMYPEHLLHAVTCAVPNQSKKSITSITKLANLASRGHLPSFVARTFCSASLAALKKTKGGVRPIAVGEVFRCLIAKCIAQEASSEAVERFSFFIQTTWCGSSIRCSKNCTCNKTNISKDIEQRKSGPTSNRLQKCFQFH